MPSSNKLPTVVQASVFSGLLQPNPPPAFFDATLDDTPSSEEIAYQSVIGTQITYFLMTGGDVQPSKWTKVQEACANPNWGLFTKAYNGDDDAINQIADITHVEPQRVALAFQMSKLFQGGDAGEALSKEGLGE